MNANREECRWRFTENAVNDVCEPQPAWETSCGLWCGVSDHTPDRHGFRNGFCFCPYCGGSLVLLLKPKEAA